MNLIPRAGALTAAGIATLVAASLAAPERTGRAERAEAAAPAELAHLAPPGSLGGGALPAPRPPARGALAARVSSLAASATAREAARPWFPVRAAFNWGQGGARFGAGRGGRGHAGQDVLARTGAPLVAVADATVVETGDDGGRGNYVAIYDADARRTYVYLHMHRPARVRPGERVSGGQRIGAVGCTGSCYGDHLHFEVRRGRGADGAAIDPLPLLRRWADADALRATLRPGEH